MTPLPEWLRPGFAPGVAAPRRRRGSLRPLRRALAALEAVLSTLVSDNRDDRRTGLLRNADPRAKLLAGVVLIVAATLLHGVAALGASFALAVGLAAAGRVRAVRVAAVLGASLALTALVMAPATLDVVTPGTPVLTVARTGGGRRAVPAPGDPGGHRRRPRGRGTDAAANLGVRHARPRPRGHLAAAGAARRAARPRRAAGVRHGADDDRTLPRGAPPRRSGAPPRDGLPAASAASASGARRRGPRPGSARSSAAPGRWPTP